GGGNCCDGSHVGVIGINLSPLQTGTSTKNSPTGNFCPGQTNVSGHLFGCFGATNCRNIRETGAPAGAVTIGTPASGKLASVFCIPGTGNGLVDASADLPGPGATALSGTFNVHHSARAARFRRGSRSPRVLRAPEASLFWAPLRPSTSTGAGHPHGEMMGL